MYTSSEKFYTTTEIFTSTEGVSLNEYDDESTTPKLETKILYSKYHTTTQEVDNLEQNDNLYSTTTEQYVDSNWFITTTEKAKPTDDPLSSSSSDQSSSSDETSVNHKIYTTTDGIEPFEDYGQKSFDSAESSNSDSESDESYYYDRLDNSDY